MKLHAYQAECVQHLANVFGHGARTVLFQLPTGGGKTHVAAELLRRAVFERGKRALFLAHLDLLLDDTSSRLHEAGVPHAVIRGGQHGQHPTLNVGSVATIHGQGMTPEADFVIIDEARRALAPSVSAIRDRYPFAKILGLDATPQRADGAPLGDAFQVLVQGPTIRELQLQGFLVRSKVLAPGDVPRPGVLSMRPDQALGTYARGRRSLVFATDLQAADHFADRIEAMGFETVVLSGASSLEQRRRVKQRLTTGTLDVVVNVDLLKDGADVPAIDCVVLASGCSVVSSYLQRVGRGLRPSPATHKSDLLVLDLSGASLEHGLPEDPRRWSLTGRASRRFGEGLQQLARCKDCFAIFHVGPPACPRCGISTRGARQPRRNTRVERQELSELDTRPLSVRDTMAIRAIENRLRASGKHHGKPGWLITKIARQMFIKAHQRAPVA